MAAASGPVGATDAPVLSCGRPCRRGTYRPCCRSGKGRPPRSAGADQRLPRVDDVLREQPAHVARLLDIAWELRLDAGFPPPVPAHRNDRSGDRRDQPIAPCDLTYDQIMRAHLHGSARLMFEHRERRWAERRARKERARRRERRAEEANRKGLHGRLVGSVRTILDGAEGEPLDPEAFRASYPGHGLYLVLKPHLKESWQFAFIEHYARFGTAQARALGHLIGRVQLAKRHGGVHRPEPVDDIGLLRTVARTFGEDAAGRGTGPRARAGRCRAGHGRARQASRSN